MFTSQLRGMTASLLQIFIVIYQLCSTVGSEKTSDTEKSFRKLQTEVFLTALAAELGSKLFMLIPNSVC